jgi:4-hydroxybenzoate polyprenyltransferase
MSRLDRVRVFLRRSRIVHWGVHVGVYALCGALYAAGFNRVPAGFQMTFGSVLILQLLLCPATYLLNDYIDIDGDRIKAPGRAHDLHRPSLRLIVLLFSGGIVWALAACHGVAGGVVAVLVAAAVAYSVPPLRLKVRGFAGVATAALAQRLPFFLILCASHELRPIAAAWIVGYLGLVGLLFILHHQGEDLEVDRAAGLRTWGVRKGRLHLHRCLLVTRITLLTWTGAAWLVASPAPTSWEVPLRFAAGCTVLTALTLVLFRHRYDRARFRRAAGGSVLLAGRGARDTARPVRIIGAGLAGMMAGIHLAERGIKVEIHTTAPSLGGMHSRVEGIHFTHLDPARLAAFLDVPLASAFVRVDVERGYHGGRRYPFGCRRAWACRRGPSAGTLDHLLHEAFRQRGGVAHFSSRVEWEAGDPAYRHIIATGLAPESFHRLGLRHRRILGYHAAGTCRPGTFATHYLDLRLGKDFAYVAGIDGYCYALVFSRDYLPEGAALHAAEMIGRTEGIELGAWTGFEGAVSLRPQLFRDGVILTGGLAGMIDPFYLGGIGGALVSGRLAALAVEEPEGASDEFRWFCRNWELCTRLSDFAQRHVAHPLVYLGAASFNSCLAPVGVP